MFGELIEGPVDPVSELLDRIAADRRHEIIEIVHDAVGACHFLMEQNITCVDSQPVTGLSNPARRCSLLWICKNLLARPRMLRPEYRSLWTSLKASRTRVLVMPLDVVLDAPADTTN
jgi:hypothetical protein